MSLTKILLAGAAISAITATSVSAFVGSVASMHLVQGSPGDKALQLKSAHHKTMIPPQQKLTDYTYTVTISMLIPPNEKYPVVLPSYAWVNSKTCQQSGSTDMGYSKDRNARIRVTTSTGPTQACPDDKFTFYGGNYTLQSKKAKRDHFVGKLTDKHTTSGFNLTLVENFDFTFKKKK